MLFKMINFAEVYILIIVKLFVIIFSFTACLMRTFMFMGFETLPPGHKSCPVNADYVFMVYTIE